jgi:hypothetical protein
MLYSAPSVYRPPFYRQNSCLSRFPPSKIPRYTAKLILKSNRIILETGNIDTASIHKISFMGTKLPHGE